MCECVCVEIDVFACVSVCVEIDMSVFVCVEGD